MIRKVREQPWVIPSVPNYLHRHVGLRIISVDVPHSKKLSLVLSLLQISLSAVCQWPLELFRIISVDIKFLLPVLFASFFQFVPRSKHVWIRGFGLFFFLIKKKNCVYFEKTKRVARVLEQSQGGCLKYWKWYRRPVDRMIVQLCMYLSFPLFSNETRPFIYAQGRLHHADKGTENE